MMLLDVVMSVGVAGVGPEGQISALAHHLESHPLATAQDIYKFLHQGIFGPGHLIPDRDEAGRYLRNEIAALDLSRVLEPPCEPLRGDPPMMRIHLRPYVVAGHQAAELLDALVASAALIEGDSRTMRRTLDAASDWLRGSGRVATAEDLTLLRSKMEGSGFPPVHHSEAYRAAYQPAYRVVRARDALERGWCGAPVPP